MKKEVRLQAEGRITIPKSFLKKMKLKQGDKLILELFQLRGGHYLFVGKMRDIVLDIILQEPHRPRRSKCK